eukprot:364442-Chlamydomonas_euryale.AAC.9
MACALVERVWAAPRPPCHTGLSIRSQQCRPRSLPRYCPTNRTCGRRWRHRAREPLRRAARLMKGAWPAGGCLARA